MIKADLAVTGISELATPEGSGALSGREMGRLKVIAGAAVACEKERIVFVGAEEEFRSSVVMNEGGAIIDAAGGAVLPGFIDAHTHLPFAGWRETEFDERLKGATYSEIAARGGGILSTVKATRAASLEELAESVRNRLDAVLAQGTTTLEAKSGYGLQTDAEIKQLTGLRQGSEGHPVEVVPTFLGAHTVPVEYRNDREGYIRLLVEEMIPRVVEERLAEYADAFVDAHAFSPAEARSVLTSARDRGLGIRVHADQLADDGGAMLAADLDAASADHLEYVSERGIEALARAGTCGVLLPGATFFLMMDRKPPGRALVDGGVPVVLATDFNPGSCPNDSMPSMLWFGCLTCGLGVDEAITASTLNAAASLGRGSETGSLEVGKRADLVVHDMPNRYHLVYRFGAPRVRAVVASGRVVVDRERPGSE